MTPRRKLLREPNDGAVSGCRPRSSPPRMAENLSRQSESRPHLSSPSWKTLNPPWLSWTASSTASLEDKVGRPRPERRRLRAIYGHHRRQRPRQTHRCRVTRSAIPRLEHQPLALPTDHPTLDSHQIKYIGLGISRRKSRTSMHTGPISALPRPPPIHPSQSRPARCRRLRFLRPSPWQERRTTKMTEVRSCVICETQLTVVEGSPSSSTTSPEAAELNAHLWPAVDSPGIRPLRPYVSMADL
jgi:hypothetical protein